MFNSIFRFLLICFILANISSAQWIEEYFDLQGLTKSGDDWEVIYEKINNKDGHIKLHQDKWLMYFLHWRPLIQEKKNLSIEYVQNLMLNFWGQAIHFEMTDIEEKLRYMDIRDISPRGISARGRFIPASLCGTAPRQIASL